jgi:hypothetical protein
VVSYPAGLGAEYPRLAPPTAAGNLGSGAMDFDHTTSIIGACWVCSPVESPVRY